MKRYATTLRVIAFTALGVLRTVPSSAQECIAPPSELVSWWPLDGGTDDIEDGNPGVLEGVGGQFVPGKVGLGFQSGGQGSLVIVPDAANLDVTLFTIDAWIRIDLINFWNMPIVWNGNSQGQAVTSPYTVGVLGTHPGPEPPPPNAIISGTPAPGKLFVTLTDGVDYHRVLSDCR